MKPGSWTDRLSPLRTLSVRLLTAPIIAYRYLMLPATTHYRQLV